MNKRFVLILFMVGGFWCKAQVSLTTEIGIGIEKPKGILLPPYGGFNFSPLIGLGVEKRVPFGLSSKYSLGICGGIAFFTGLDDKSRYDSFTSNNLASYTQKNISATLTRNFYINYTPKSKTYYQIPLKLRLNYQPYVLMDDMLIFMGGGVTFGFLSKASLTSSVYGNTVNNGNIENEFSFTLTEDITNLSSSTKTFLCIEAGFSIQRLTILLRHQFSNSNSIPHNINSQRGESIVLRGYESGLVPNSADFQGSPLVLVNEENGLIKEFYSQLVIQLRLNKINRL